MSKADKLSTHLERWEAAKEARFPWDKDARQDLRVLNGKTWTTDELAVFEEQGRDPTNYNLVAGTMRLVAGVEAQSRTDPNYLGRGPADQEGAKAATRAGLMVRDQNSSNRQLSRQFWDAITTGIGWMEVAGDPDPYSLGILERRVNPFMVWGDPCGKEPDMSDWIDVFRSVVTYPHQLAMRFEKQRDIILGAADYLGLDNGLSHSADWTIEHGDIPDVDQWDDMGIGMAEKPRQIRAVERWYKVEEWTRIIRFRDGRVYEPGKLDITRRDDKALLQMLAGALVSRQAKLIKTIVPRIRVAVFLPDEINCLLSDDESPYSHNAFPFVPMWAYEDEYGRPVGLVRQQRCPQRDFNARMAHLLKLALNTQTWYEEGAFVDEAEALSEIAKPNGNVRLTEGGKDKVLDRSKLEAAPIESQMLEIDRNMIQEYSGVTPELMGQESNASSGTAIQSRQAQGQTRLYTLFDNRNWTQEQIAERRLALMRDTFTEEMAVRINESAQGVHFITINERMPDGTVRNDLSQGRFDVHVSLTGAKDSAAVAALESVTNLASQLGPDLQFIFAPQIARLAGQVTGMEETKTLVDELTKLKDAMMAKLIGPAPGAMPQMDVQAQQAAPGPMATGQESDPGPMPGVMA